MGSIKLNTDVENTIPQTVFLAPKEIMNLSDFPSRYRSVQDLGFIVSIYLDKLQVVRRPKVTLVEKDSFLAFIRHIEEYNPYSIF